MPQTLSRRLFMQTGAAVAASLTILPARTIRGSQANEKLRIGVIGVGGRGAANLDGVSGEAVVALCDVDRGHLQGAANRFPGVKTYIDYRQLLADEQDLDAVVVSTADHTHATASVPAMRRGLHVYCEKPLTHNVYEARVMGDLAREKKLITHMGTGAQSEEASIRTVEAIRAGHIGDVVEAHCWTNRPIWPQGYDRPEGEDPVPENLDWNLWLGPAPVRPFKQQWPEGHPARASHAQAYHPFVWRGWWDFGTGALGDIAPHIMNAVFWALELGPPERVEVVETSGMTAEMFPHWSIIRFDFPGQNGKPPMKLFWYDGDKLPPAELLADCEGGPILFVGTKGRLRVGGTPVPKKDFEGYQWPEPTLPRHKENHQEWIDCVKEGRLTGCPFEYAGPMTEAYLLGNIALKVGRPIGWNAAELKIPDDAEATALVRREYRDGWSLD